MPTLDIHIAAGADDGLSHGGGGFDGTGTLTAIGNAGSALFDSFYRFANVTIPQGATINVAYLTYVEGGASNPGNILSNIYLNDEDDATAPTDRTTQEAKTRTTAFTVFDDLTGISTTGTTYNTPAFTAAVQEVVDRAGWVSGNAMMVLWDDDGTAINNSYTEPASIEHATFTEPILHIEYSAGTTLSGVLFQKAPTFSLGQLKYTQTLTGTLFTKAPTFPTGTVSSPRLLQGILFAKAPTFPVGAITGGAGLLQGALFTKAPSFFVGVVRGGLQTLTGAIFQKNSMFFSGTINAAGSVATSPSTTDEGLRFEAWTLPQLGGFTRKFDLSRWIPAFTIADKFGDISDGELTLAADSGGGLLPLEKMDKLIKVDRANHANDVGSVIRVLRGTTPILHYVTKQYDDEWSSDKPTATLKLEGMELLLDRATVPNFDYPVNPSVNSDWIYGAASVLINTDFENSGITSEVVNLTLTDATAGTFKIGVDYPVGAGFVYTANIPFNPGASDIAVALEALTDIDDVLVTGAGTATSPFVIEVLAPAKVDMGWATDSSLLAGTASIVTEVNGGNISTDPWHRSQNPITGLLHGSYTTFAISTEQAHTGTYSLKVDGDPPASAGAFPGAQQLLSVTPGRQYRASVWVYPTSTASFRLVIRTRDETYIASEQTVLTANSWQQISISTVTIPSWVPQIIFRIATTSSGDEPAWYVDDALFAPGAVAATFGAIISDLLTPIQANGRLTWLTPTWTDTVDSSGATWDRNLEWSVKRGQTLLQLVEYAKKWNYESRIRWDDNQSRFEWDLFNPTKGGTNHTGSGLAITGRSISSSGVIARRFPDSTHYHTEGEGGRWGEHNDSTMSGAWGPLDKYFANAQGLDADGLGELAERLVNDAKGRTDGLSVRLQLPSALPWSKFNPGDVLKVNLEPQRDAEALRCIAVVASKGPEDATPAYDVHFGSVVYQGEAAVLQTLRILWRKFQTLETTPATRETIVNPVLPAEPVVPLSRIEIVLAASNTHTDLLPFADFVCDGANDEETWGEAIETLDRFGAFNGSYGSRGTIIVLDGTYNFDDFFFLDTAAGGGIDFRGDGRPVVLLNYNDADPGGGVGNAIFNVPGGGDSSDHTQLRFRNLCFDGGNLSNGRFMFMSTLTAKPNIHITDCVFRNFKKNLIFSERGSPYKLHNSEIYNSAFSDAAFRFDAGTTLSRHIHHNTWIGCTGNMVSGFSFSDHTLIDGNIQGNGTMVTNALGGVTYANNVGF